MFLLFSLTPNRLLKSLLLDNTISMSYFFFIFFKKKDFRDFIWNIWLRLLFYKKIFELFYSKALIFLLRFLNLFFFFFYIKRQYFTNFHRYYRRTLLSWDVAKRHIAAIRIKENVPRNNNVSTERQKNKTSNKHWQITRGLSLFFFIHIHW